MDNISKLDQATLLQKLSSVEHVVNEFSSGEALSRERIYEQVPAALLNLYDVLDELRHLLTSCKRQIQLDGEAGTCEDVKSVLVEILLDDRLRLRAKSEQLLDLVVESLNRPGPGLSSQEQVEQLADRVLMPEFLASLGKDSEPRWGDYDGLETCLKLAFDTEIKS